MSNPENSRAVFAPSEILRGLLGAARERPPLYAPRPPLPGVSPRAADGTAPRPPLRPVRGGERAQTRLGPFPRRGPCSYARGSERGPLRVDPANQNEHRVKPRGVSPDTVETLEEPWTRHRT